MVYGNFTNSCKRMRQLTGKHGLYSRAIFKEQLNAKVHLLDSIRRKQSLHSLLCVHVTTDVILFETVCLNFGCAAFVCVCAFVLLYHFLGNDRKKHTSTRIRA